jgi:hypothetical protein
VHRFSDPAVTVLISITSEVFKVLKIQYESWVLTPCSVVVGYQRFGRPCCFHLQSEALLSSRGLLGCDAVKCCGRIPTFRKSMSPPSSGWSFAIKSRSSGLWRRLVLWVDTNVSEVHAASIFRVKLCYQVEVFLVVTPCELRASEFTRLALRHIDLWKDMDHFTSICPDYLQFQSFK